MEKNELITKLKNVKNEQIKLYNTEKQYRDKQKQAEDISREIVRSKDEIRALKNSKFQLDMPEKSKYRKGKEDIIQHTVITQILISVFAHLAYLIFFIVLIFLTDHEGYSVLEIGMTVFLSGILPTLVLTGVETSVVDWMYHKIFDDGERPAIWQILLALFTGYMHWYYVQFVLEGTTLRTVGAIFAIIVPLSPILLYFPVRLLYIWLYNRLAGDKKYQKDYEEYLSKKPEEEKNFEAKKEKDIKKLEEKIDSRNKLLEETIKEEETIKSQVEEIEKSLNNICEEVPLHASYRNQKSVDCFMDYLEKGRADTLKECLNLYEEETKQNQMAEKIETAKNIAKIASERADEAVNNSNSAMNMAANARNIANNASDIATEASNKAQKQEQIQDEYNEYSERYKDIKRKHQ